MKLIRCIISVICILLMLWFFLSMLEVNAKNFKSNPQYCEKNIFVMITKEDKIA